MCKQVYNDVFIFYNDFNVVCELYINCLCFPKIVLLGVQYESVFCPQSSIDICAIFCIRFLYDVSYSSCIAD